MSKNKHNREHDCDYYKTQNTWCQRLANIWIFKEERSVYLNSNIYTLKMIAIFVFEGILGFKIFTSCICSWETT